MNDAWSYQEEQTWPLTSDTTCYTGAQQSTSSHVSTLDATAPTTASVDVAWATQTHTCRFQVLCGEDATNRTGKEPSTPATHPSATSIPEQPVKHCRPAVPIPLVSRSIHAVRDHADDDLSSHESLIDPRRHQICVGYSMINDWEALALLDTTTLQTTAHEPADLGAPVIAPPATPATPPVPDSSHGLSSSDSHASLSVITAPPTTTSASSPSRHVRSSSYASLSDVSLTSKPDSMDKSHLDEWTEMTVTLDDSPPRLASMDAQLVLRRRRDSMEYATTLDFRPLAVTVFAHSEPNVDESGVWLGSADSCKLYCFVPSRPPTDLLLDTGNQQSLVPLTLGHAAFGFATPVMAISYTSASSTHCLTVACQDGTVRFIAFTFSHENGTLACTNVRFRQVIVDGPIVCAHHSVWHVRDETFVSIVAGSLCGYATELSMDLRTMTVHGPFMVTNALWSARLATEDSVLAIHTTRDTIVLGTLTGRCLVYTRCDASNTNEACLSAEPVYQRQWECQLPHSIHGVTLWHDRLVVTTRRSVHVFQRKTHTVLPDTSIAEMALATKERLLAMLQRNPTVDPTSSV